MGSSRGPHPCLYAEHYDREPSSEEEASAGVPQHAARRRTADAGHGGRGVRPPQRSRRGPHDAPGRRDDPLDGGDVWTYRDPHTGKVALLLFSDAVHKPASLPPGVALQSPAWLRAFLGTHNETITCIFFDIAGPHPMQSTIDDLIAALDA